MRVSARLTHSMAAIVALCLAVVYRFAPGEGTFYPQCLFFQWTGWECPGCGSTRALHALLHLRLAEAVALNPLFTIAFPLLLAFGIAQYFTLISSGRTFSIPLPRHAYAALLVSTLMFAGLRNLSF